MIVRADVVVTMDGLPVENGAVQVEGERIVGVSRSNIKHQRSKIIDLSGHVLLPGLINAHCHLDYTCLRGKIAPTQSFADWIRAINAQKAKLTAGDFLRSIADGSAEAERFGTTAIVNLEAFPELIGRTAHAPLRTWWCAELIDVTASNKMSAILSAAADAARGIEDGSFGLAPHALFTASPQLYRDCQKIAAAENWLLTTHLAESPEEMEMFRDGSGRLFEFLRGLGRCGSDCGNATPVQNFLRIIRDSSSRKAFEAQNDRNGSVGRWLVAHLNELTEADFESLEELPQKFSIAHCPRSHAYFGHWPFAFERLRQLGFNICLGTDSLASNANLSLFGEMRALRENHAETQPFDVLKMVTVNPAKALRRATELGKIAPGFFADMIALPITGGGKIYDQIIAFDSDVPWMMIGGNIL